MRHKNHSYLWLLIVSALVIAVMVGLNVPWGGRTSGPAVDSSTSAKSFESRLLEAFQRQESNLQVQVSAPVSRILPDDNDGSRHQRFLIKLSTGQTILVSHNIDLAPRVDGLLPGHTVTVSGEYEWNHRGGVIHWTHHDPRGDHEDGWIEHQGRRYQ